MKRRASPVSYETCELAYAVLTGKFGMTFDTFKVLEQLQAASESRLLKNILDLVEQSNDNVLGKVFRLPEPYVGLSFDDFVETLRESYTRGVVPDEVVEERLPMRYPMTFVRSDMIKLLSLLNQDAEHSEELLAWGDDTRSCILETLGIEEI